MCDGLSELLNKLFRLNTQTASKPHSSSPWWGESIANVYVYLNDERYPVCLGQFENEVIVQY